MDTESKDETQPEEATCLKYEENGGRHSPLIGVTYNATENEEKDIDILSESKNTNVFVKMLRMPFYSQERVSWFAIILLFILFYIYVLNQADRLVLPVLIPAGLRCDYSSKNVTCLQNLQQEQKSTFLFAKESSLLEKQSNNASNVTTNPPPNSGCIAFNEYEQGILTGPAFIVIYVIAGLPLGYLADRKSRPLVLISGFFIWSIAIILTGFVAFYWELVALRILLGIGEATCNPVAYSLLADFYPENRRAFAFSVYHFGVYLGGSIGYLCGVINEHLSWQWTYHILGIIGVVSIPIAFVTFWEPKSVRESRRRRRQERSQISIADLCIYFLKPSYTASTYWLLLLCGSVRNIAGYSLLTWLPTFFVKEYCVGSADYGWKVALVVLFGGGLGSFLGGFFSDRLTKYNIPNGRAVVISIGQLLAVPANIAVFLAPLFSPGNANVSYGMLFLAYLTAETWLGPAAALVQDITKPSMRTVGSALYVGVITIVASVGPLLVPAFFSQGGEFDEKTGHGVRNGLLLTVPVIYFVSSILFAILGVVVWVGYRTGKLKKDYAEFDDETELIREAD
jgi:MFS family permease